MGEEDRALEAPAAAKMDDTDIKQNGVILKKERRSASTSPNQSKPPSRSSSMSPGIKAENESASTPDTEPVPKSSKKSSSKARARSPPLFDHLPDATEDSKKSFLVINDCLYGAKHMGSSDNDALDCDCVPEMRKSPILMRPHCTGWTP